MQTTWTMYAVRITRTDGTTAMLGGYSGQVPECWGSAAVAEVAAKANRTNDGVADAQVVPVTCAVDAVPVAPPVPEPAAVPADEPTLFTAAA